MSNPKWQTLTQVPIGASIQAAIDAINAVVSAISGVLNAVVAGLEIIKALALLTLNLLKAIVQELLNLIKELILDILEFNVGIALHLNINWNPFWVLDKERKRNRRTGKIDPRLIDYANDGQLPWSGTGTVGWLLDIAASAEDPTDPFRPVTDGNTKVGGFMFIKGVANPNELESSLRFSDWVDLFTKWKGLLTDFEKPTAVAQISNAKLASAGFWEALAVLYGLGPKESQALKFKNSIADPRVDNYWNQYAPTPGSYPKWVSIPLATLVPPIQAIASSLQKILGLLLYTDDFFDSITKLIEIIEAKLSALVEAIQQVQDALNLLIALAAFITDSYFIQYSVPSGGMSSFISEAIAAEDIPYFGDAGIVLGICAIATNPDSQASMDKFLEFLGIQSAAYDAELTASEQALNDTFTELFP